MKCRRDQQAMISVFILQYPFYIHRIFMGIFRFTLYYDITYRYPCHNHYFLQLISFRTCLGDQAPYSPGDQYLFNDSFFIKLDGVCNPVSAMMKIYPVSWLAII